MHETKNLTREASFDTIQIISPTSSRAGFQVLEVIAMLAFRILGLLPASIALTLAEAKQLPANLETVIPSLTKKRGATISEIFQGERAPEGPAAFGSAFKGIRIPQLIWLLELHLKKCFVQLVFEVITESIVFWLIV